jgi:hypothetical protein
MESVTPNVFTLQIDTGNTPYLNEAAKWAKFLAIVGFVFCGLIAVAAFFAGTLLSTYFGQFEATDTSNSVSSITGIFLTVYYLIVAILYFIPSLYLFNFASKMQAALRNNDQMTLNTSFRNLKACFKFWGILFIILLCFMVIVVIVAVAGASLA